MKKLDVNKELEAMSNSMLKVAYMEICNELTKRKMRRRIANTKVIAE